LEAGGGGGRSGGVASETEELSLGPKESEYYEAGKRDAVRIRMLCSIPLHGGSELGKKGRYKYGRRPEGCAHAGAVGSG